MIFNNIYYSYLTHAYTPLGRIKLQGILRTEMLLADGKRMSAISAVGTRRVDTVRQVKLIEMRLKCLSLSARRLLYDDGTVRAISAPTIIYENCKNRIKFS